MNRIDIKLQGHKAQISIDGKPIDGHHCIGYTLCHRAGEPAKLTIEYEADALDGAICGDAEVIKILERGD